MNMAVASYKATSFLSEVSLLLVDPDKTNRSILTGLIEDMKPRRFMAAKSLAEGRLAMADRLEAFDVVLLAVKNPPTSGFHYLQEIRAGGIPRVNPNTRVILVSQPPNRTMIDLASTLDADGILTLPMSSATVSNTLSKALKRDREVKKPESYLSVKLPKPVKKKPKKDAGPNAWVVWSKKEKEKADLLQSLESALATIKEESAVEPARIENVKTYWLRISAPA